MDELISLPREYLEPLLPCFDLLKKCNVQFFDDRALFWRVLPYFYILPAVLAFHTALTIYLIEGFKRNMDLDELVYVVPVYVVCAQTFYWMNMIGSWQYILSPLLQTTFRKVILRQDSEFLLPFGCYFPFDPRRNWIVYLAAYFFEAYSMITIVYCYLGSEFLMIILCSHLGTEFTLLQSDIQGYQETPGNRSISHFNEQESCASDFESYVNDKTDLKALIRRHQILIGFAQDLDNIFNKMIFVNLSSASISICFFGFSAKVSHDAVALINNFVGVVASMLPIFNLCYYAEMLKEANEGIAIAAYNNLWYRSSKSYGKAIWFLIKRSQKACCLTSLKYNPISLSTFTTVMSTTWSYFSLASSLYDENSEK